MIRLETDRLILRGWEERDVAPFAAMNADPKVMEYVPATLTEAETRLRISWFTEGIAEHGFHFQPIEEKQSGRFAGFVGIAHVPSDVPFAPAVEIGWRLPVDFGGKGYATEAATAWLEHGFEALGLDEIVSFAVQGNKRSLAVMERIGMTYDPDGDFRHPKLPPDHPLALHVLYRMRREDFRRRS